MEQIKSRVKELRHNQRLLLKSINEKKKSMTELQELINIDTTEYVKLDGAIREFEAMLPREKK